MEEFRLWSVDLFIKMSIYLDTLKYLREYYERKLRIMRHF